MVGLKKIVIGFIASLPFYALAERAEFNKVTGKIERSVIKDSLLNALIDGYAPDNFFIYLQDNQIYDVQDLMLARNKKILEKITSEWEALLVEEMIMAGSSLSIGNGSNNGNKIL